MLFTPQLQMQADRLKRITVNGIPTKLVAVGIGSGVIAELSNIASTPVDRNVIHVRDFSSLNDVEEQLSNTSCTPSLPSNCSMSRICNCEKINVEVLPYS